MSFIIKYNIKYQITFHSMINIELACNLFENKLKINVNFTLNNVNRM